MIGNLDESDFVKILHQHLSPTAPIQLEENLCGRDAQVRKIKQALYAPGRSIFIYGDRGVGKTSLAQTVAFKHQSASRDPVFLACAPQTTFGDIMRDVINALESGRDSGASMTHQGTVGVPGVASYQVIRHAPQQIDIAASAAAPIDDLNQVVALLSQVSTNTKADTVVVIDEFDRIASDEERSHFADFIKQIGDRQITIRFVFCGVGESLEKLLGAHGSCYRYLESVELPRLSWDARWEIIDRAAAALKVTVGDRPRFRIAAISDGFPHYVHLVCEKLFWEMFDDPEPCVAAGSGHYTSAVASAVLGIEQHLKQAYDTAIMQNADGFEEVLWAVADHSDLFRRADNIYESYLDVMRAVDRPPLDRQIFAARLRTLKSARCKQILATNRAGWLHFRESIVRGYVRLRAEEQGVELALEYQSAKVKQGSWPQRGAKRGRFGTTQRDWQQMQNPDGEESGS
ncbi:MAG: ATP-binding protein [Nitrososphaerales archaeon]|jgi:uncharacterized protein